MIGMDRSVEIFDRHLRENGTTKELINVITDTAHSLPVRASGRLTYRLAVELNKVNKYYMIEVEIVFDDMQRDTKIIKAKQLTTDEYIAIAWAEDPQLRLTVLEMIGYIR